MVIHAFNVNHHILPVKLKNELTQFIRHITRVHNNTIARASFLLGVFLPENGNASHCVEQVSTGWEAWGWCWGNTASFESPLKENGFHLSFLFHLVLIPPFVILPPTWSQKKGSRVSGFSLQRLTSWTWVYLAFVGYCWLCVHYLLFLKKDENGGYTCLLKLIFQSQRHNIRDYSCNDASFGLQSQLQLHIRMVSHRPLTWPKFFPNGSLRRVKTSAKVGARKGRLPN